MTRKSTRTRVAKYAIVLGILLALTCHFLPQDYQAACQLLASVCAAGH